jgi:hypothetical protein
LGNKDLDIESLYNKLKTFETEPDGETWGKIFENLNVLDYNLNESLRDLELEPNKGSKEIIFEQLNLANPIDLILNEKLAELDIDPNKSFYEVIPANSNRKKALVLFLSLLLAFMLGLFSKYSADSDKTGNLIERDTLETGKSKQNNSSILDQNQNPAYRKEAEKMGRQSRSRKQIIKTNEESTKELIVNLDSNQDQLLSKINLIKNEITYTIELPQKINIYQSKLTFKNKLKTPKVQILGRLGFQNQMLKDAQIENPEYQHKDALNNFKNSNGNNLLGIQFTAGIAINLSKKFYCRTSFQYNYTQNNKQFNYQYTDIPVYGIDGKIIGYFNRPLSASPQVNQNIKTSIQTLVIPVEAFYEVYDLRKTKIYLGLGLNVGLINHYKSLGFSFNKEALNDSKSKSKRQLFPNLSIQYLYQMNPQTIMMIQFEGFNTSSKTNFDQSTFRSKYLSSVISIGFSFVPKF